MSSNAKKMKKSILIGIVCMLLMMYFYVVDDKKDSGIVSEEELYVMIETEILDTEGGDESMTVFIAKEGGYDEIWLREDTVVKNEKGEILDFSSLEKGMSFTAKVCPDVMYEAVVYSPRFDIANASVDIYYRCYEIIVHEK